MTPRQEILATMETSSPNTIISQSWCESREEETSLPLQPHPAEQLGASWEHHHAGNKAVVVSWALGELGGEFLSLSGKASGGCFFLFFFAFLWVWFFPC